MKDFFSRSWVVIVLIAVFLALVMGICSAVTGGRVSPVSQVINILVSPIQKLTGSIKGGVDGYFEKLNNYDALSAENEELRKNLANAEHMLREANVAILENNQLRGALDMKAKDTQLVFESAEIVARGDTNLGVTFTIDKGSVNGIAVNNCVVTTDGMVGYVSEVGANWAIVTSVIDTGMEASAIVSRTRDVASAEGDYELMRDGKLRLSYISKDSQIVRGDTVETSGFGGLFPKGIIIGRVEEVKSEAHGITKYAILTPTVDFKNINRVLVIKEFKVTE